MLSFLPLVAMEGGMSQSRALASASILLTGDAALQFGIGWLADHLGRRRVHLLCGMLVCLLLPLMPLMMQLAGLWEGYLFLLGVCRCHLYPGDGSQWRAIQRGGTAAHLQPDLPELERVQQPGPCRHRAGDAACRFGLDGVRVVGHGPAVCAEQLAATRGSTASRPTLSACQHTDFFVRLNTLTVFDGIHHAASQTTIADTRPDCPRMAAITQFSSQRPTMADAPDRRAGHRPAAIDCRPVRPTGLWPAVVLGRHGVSLPATPMHHRMVTIMACSFGLIASFTLGLLSQLLPLAAAPVLAVITILVTMICRFYRLPPPGSYFL
jgi:hypothetical protein